MIKYLLFSLILFTTSTSLAANRSVVWLSLSTNAKIAYVMGYEDGFWKGCSELAVAETKSNSEAMDALKHSSDVCGKLIPTKVSGEYGSIVDIMDSFYKDKSNSLVPFENIYLFSIAKMSGKPDSDIQSELEMIRKVSAARK